MTLIPSPDWLKMSIFYPVSFLFYFSKKPVLNYFPAFRLMQAILYTCYLYRKPFHIMTYLNDQNIWSFTLCLSSTPPKKQQIYVQCKQFSPYFYIIDYITMPHTWVHCPACAWVTKNISLLPFSLLQNAHHYYLPSFHITQAIVYALFHAGSNLTTPHTLDHLNLMILFQVFSSSSSSKLLYKYLFAFHLPREIFWRSI